MSSAAGPAEVDGRRVAAAARRRAREAEIIAATREIFDTKGVRDVRVDEIATAVGINRAILYRHFTGKEELFALTLVGYLNELHDTMQEAAGGPDGPRERLRAIAAAFVDYGVEHPAFVDCALALMQRPGDELLGEIAEGPLVELGRGITSCLTILSDVLAAGAADGVFELEEEPVLLANALYASSLGALQLARLGILVSESAPGVPVVGQISSDQVRSYVVHTALALALPQSD